MSKKCEHCGKTPQSGHHVSHSNIKTNRRFNPNLQTVRHQTPDGTVRRITLCTRCIRSGAVTKPVARKQDLVFETAGLVYRVPVRSPQTAPDFASFMSSF